MMTRRTSYFVCATLLLCLHCATSQDLGDIRHARPGEPMPRFALKTIDGGSVASQDYKGKALLLSFLRPDNSRSVKTLKAMQKLADRLNDPNLAVLVIAAGPGVQADMKKLVADHGFKRPVALDPERVAYGHFGVVVTPTTYVIDRKSTVRFILPAFPLQYEKKLAAHTSLALGKIDHKEHDRLLASPALPTGIESADIATRTRVAKSLIENRRFGQAETLLQALRAEHPEELRVAGLMGWLLLKTQRHEAAAKLLDPLRKTPKPPLDLLLALGRLDRERGRVKESLSFLTSAQKLSPGNAEVLFELGRAHERGGDVPAAVEAYRKALMVVFGERR